eukprot:CAMPEP_0197290352 /NCGR_PEP_ID=MMETSP0890-20130614/7574_1 /TAXON_ID=44058 ORGANISM="Aureoumbra lagunensis, Strain CCMP1510" /NCGR_SAMPLE_ID=MMETSP0890 /ASSEMBLY_ACC=CAM_ASM_000533 /LENGTH=429 /DNA_ID=CAMNT_0042762301 /DNA_START=315 /DNA_END=1604 /DNA_ORIENTATION=+
MSDTGGGHRASAQALGHALERLYPSKIEYEILDIWTEYAPWPYKKFVPWYAYVAKRPLMWRALWSYARFPLTRRVQEFSARVQCFDDFEKAFRDREPLDAVVSVHPLCQTLPLRVVRKLDKEQNRPETPFVTVVTDLASAHPTWFHKDVDACFVPSDAVAKIAKKVGLQDEKIKQHGLPLRHAFWEPETRPKAQMRKTLSLPENMETALLVGGGDGVGRISSLAKVIGKELGKEEATFGKKKISKQSEHNNKNQQFSLVIICGRNEEAQRELEAYDWPANVHATILGFVKNIDEYMAAADCLITKAGPGTIAEASTRGLPTLISSYLPGQEFGNVQYVCHEKQFGVFHRRPKRIAKTIRTWLQDNHTRSQLAAKAFSAAQLNATTNIAKDIAHYLGFDHNASSTYEFYHNGDQNQHITQHESSATARLA